MGDGGDGSDGNDSGDSGGIGGLDAGGFGGQGFGDSNTGGFTDGGYSADSAGGYGDAAGIGGVSLDGALTSFNAAKDSAAYSAAAGLTAADVSVFDGTVNLMNAPAIDAMGNPIAAPAKTFTAKDAVTVGFSLAALASGNLLAAGKAGFALGEMAMGFAGSPAPSPGFAGAPGTHSGTNSLGGGFSDGASGGFGGADAGSVFGGSGGGGLGGYTATRGPSSPGSGYAPTSGYSGLPFDTSAPTQFFPGRGLGLSLRGGPNSRTGRSPGASSGSTGGTGFPAAAAVIGALALAFS